MMGPEPDAMAARPHSLPPPDDEEVERLLRTVALRVVRLFRKQGKLDNLTCDGVLDALRAQATQRRLPLNEEEPSPPKRRCAFLEGFSLHANTRVHENDRDNLRRLCSYGARGLLKSRAPLAVARWPPRLPHEASRRLRPNRARPRAPRIPPSPRSPRSPAPRQLGPLLRLLCAQREPA